MNEQHECMYCGRIVPAEDDVPPVKDDVAWQRLAKLHEPDCEWVRTRAHRKDAAAAKEG